MSDQTIPASPRRRAKSVPHGNLLRRDKLIIQVDYRYLYYLIVELDCDRFRNSSSLHYITLASVPRKKHRLSLIQKLPLLLQNELLKPTTNVY
jgi:hypothetical protein